jgi:hypothetical protein
MMTSGEAWRLCREADIEELKVIAIRPGFDILEEEARSQLRGRLHAHIQGLLHEPGLICSAESS